MNAVTKVFFPNIPLQKMLMRSGGISREMAIDTALENLRTIRGDSNSVIDAALAEIERIAHDAADGTLGPAPMKTIMEHTDQIVALAGTFGYDALDRAGRGLCDLIEGLIQTGKNDAAPVQVHVRALRLFAPTSSAPGTEETERVLGELQKILTFYGLARSAD